MSDAPPQSDTPPQGDLDGMIDRYLGELDRALARLPLSERDQLVGEIRDHITELRSERPVLDASGMEALLNRVGLPEDIAAVALEGRDIAEPVEPSEPVERIDDEPRAHHVPMSSPLSGAFGFSPSGLRRISGPQRAGLVGVAIAIALVLVVGIASVTAGRHGAPASQNPPTHTSGGSTTPPSPTSRVAVPNVIGMSVAQATVTLGSADLGEADVTRPSSTVAAGLVVSQGPVAGSIAMRHSIVTLVVSSGPT
jgi:PASTA domain